VIKSKLISSRSYNILHCLHLTFYKKFISRNLKGRDSSGDTGNRYVTHIKIILGEQLVRQWTASVEYPVAVCVEEILSVRFPLKNSLCDQMANLLSMN
jgi:hypothetical protein